MDQELATKVLASGDMPHGSRGLASVLESELQHPRVDLGMLGESLESPRLRHASAGKGPKKNYSESGLGLVLMPDMESGSSKAGDLHHRAGHGRGRRRSRAPRLDHQIPRPTAPKC